MEVVQVKPDLRMFTVVKVNSIPLFMKVKSEREVAQSCPTLRDPVDCSLPGSSVHGIKRSLFKGDICMGDFAPPSMGFSRQE